MAYDEDMIYVNFKTYDQGTGAKALAMAEMIRRVSLVFGIEVVGVVQAGDVYRISSGVEHDWVWCQHADGIEYGAHSGWLLPESIKQNGAAGVMLNHAERKLEWEFLEASVQRCRAVGLRVGVCADSLEEVERVLPLSPDWIAYEPPELIGNKELSVSTAKPEVVEAAVKMCGETTLLIGAGIQGAGDIRKGLELGAKGFLLASSVMTSENPETKLRELLGGYGEE